MLSNKGAATLTWTQRLRLALARAYVSRELPGWSSVYNILVGSFERDNLWKNAPTVDGRNKYFGYKCAYDLARWANRQTYVLGRWNDLPTQLVLRALKPKIILDIGANRGEFTLAAASMHPEARVISFEPNPAMLEILKHDLHRNHIDNVEVREYALGDQAGTFPLHVPRVNSGSASFGGFESEGYTVEVPVQIGDDVLTAADLIKIDVEGFEVRALKGLEQLIRTSQPVIVTEYFSENLKRCGTSLEELTEFVTGLGYRGFGMDTVRRGMAHELRLGAMVDGTDAVWLPSHMERLTASSKDLRR